MRSIDDRFRAEVEQILDTIIPHYVDADRLVTIRASEVTEAFDWQELLERLLGPPPVGDPTPKPVQLTPTLWD